MHHASGAGLAQVIVRQMIIKAVSRAALAGAIKVSRDVLDAWLVDADSMPLYALSRVALVLEVSPAGLLQASETLAAADARSSS